MSYGWLTESALIPKKAKDIKVDANSLVDLKVMLMNEKNKARVTTKNDKKSIYDKLNKGVEMRNKRDQEQEKTLNQSKSTLEQKAKLYEQLVSNGKNVVDDKYLVDFDLKNMDNMSQVEESQFEEYKKQFYTELQSKAQQKEYNIQQRKYVELSKDIDKMERERAAWENEATRYTQNDSGVEIDPNRKLVLQSYDKILTKEEKEHLPEIIQETKDTKYKVSEIKRKRQEIQEMRKEKLKKIQTGGNDKNLLKEQSQT